MIAARDRRLRASPAEFRKGLSEDAADPPAHERVGEPATLRQRDAEAHGFSFRGGQGIRALVVLW